MDANHGQFKTDALVVGAGPAGLACAIRLARRTERPIRIAVLEKSAHPGGHLLSGAVVRPEPLAALLDPRDFADLPLGPPVVRDSFHALSRSRSLRLPFVPPAMRMQGLPLVSAAALGRSLAKVAESLGVEIFWGQTADSIVWNGDRVAGVRCGADSILAPSVVLAEGPAGLLSREAFSRFPGSRAANLQTHGIGFKEIVEIPPNPSAVGSVLHTFGHPLGIGHYGGGFIYHFDAAHVAVGLVLALDYSDPSLHLHDLFRRWKRHPLVQSRIAGGRAVEYGSRLVPEGGWHSIPKLALPGAFVVGDSAGLVDSLELKGIHLAIESGMAAADAILEGRPLDLSGVPSLASLRRSANYRAAFRAGLPFGMAAAGLSWISGLSLPPGRVPQRDERLSFRPGHFSRNPPRSGTADASPLDLGVDSDLFLARLRVRAGACHIAIKNESACANCFAAYAAPCTRFCPAAVYEAAADSPTIRLRAENCLQCRCCTLKCPLDNIAWETPLHGVGPDYRDL